MQLELTVVMPCLNEAETLASCIAKAKAGIAKAGISGEIVIADNGSTDDSIKIATQLGARVVHVREKGYGSALQGGIAAASSPWIVMGDADDSYDFSELDGFIEKLRRGNALVMGCRLPGGGGTILPGAMPWKNRWIGNPGLSFIGRLFFKTPIHDFYCGLRAFNKEAIDALELKTTGMEFATEMVMKATLKQLPMAEVPITLHRDGRSRRPHLRPWRDGWRTLRFMLIYSPRWLYLVPGIILIIIGVAGTLALSWQPISVFHIEFDAGTQFVAAMSIVTGVQLVSFACFTKVFGIAEGLLPEDRRFAEVFRVLTLERGLVIGGAVLLVGCALFLRALLRWKAAHFGPLSYSENLRLLVPAVTSIVIGLQIIFSSFFMSVLGLKTSHRHPPEPSPDL